MSPRIVVLGAGAMGGAAARLLARHQDVELVVVDADHARAAAMVEAAGRGEAVAAGGDPAEALRGADAVACCLPYRLNLMAMEAALSAGVPYADLGGLFHMTRRQLELDDRFRAAGLAAVVGIGCCPGISNLLAAAAAARMDRVETIEIVDGAIEDVSEFGVPYSAETILDEFTLPAMVFEDGALREVPAASGRVMHRFPEPLGEMEAFYTLHSEPATLPQTIPGVRNVRWRLALPPDVARGFHLLAALGLAETSPVTVGDASVAPRDVLLALLRRMPAPDGPPTDHEVLEVRASGTVGGKPATFLGRATFVPQPEGVGAGAFGTAIPIAVAARWLAEGRVEPGVHPPETAFDADGFLKVLEAEGVRLEISVL
jgi:saccharopine dehydrogenase-like NADP-dependent oxidoreductase